MLEEWRDVVGWEGLYEVSNLGRVYSTRTKRILRPQRTGINKNYAGVDLSLGGKYKRYLIHRLVAEVFLARIDGMDIVNHLDGDPTNNKIDNLEWVTVARNTQHAYDVGLNKGRRIEVIQYKGNTEVARYASVPEAAKALGVSNSAVRNVCGGFADTCKGYIFKYNREGEGIS